MNFKSNSNHFLKALKMFCLLILLLVTFSIDCQNQTQDMCPIIKPNGNYEGLGIYRGYYWDKRRITSDYVMYNRAGSQWLFGVTFDEMTRSFDIKMIANSVHTTQHREVVHRFSTYHTMSSLYMDCWVEKAVKLLNYNKLLLFSIN